jgi:hypothetical protein
VIEMHGWRKTVTLKRLVVLATAASLGGTGTFVWAKGSQPNAGDPGSPWSLSLQQSRQSAPGLAERAQKIDEETASGLLTRERTTEERRLEFEREYGIRQQNQSWFLGMLRSAKYGLDKMSFTAKETARRLQFTYELGSPTGFGGRTIEPQYSLPVFGAFGHPQVKTVLTEHDPQTGTPFIGLKLAIPFGGNDQGPGVASGTRGD